MTEVGEVLELWRYPVSSLGGERVDSIEVSAAGIDGDRRFALIDPETGLPASPERDPRWRPALFLSSRSATTDTVSPLPEIQFPDGLALRLNDQSLPERLADHFGFAVSIGRYHDSEDDTSMFRTVVNRYVPSALHLLTTASLENLASVADIAEADRRRFRPSLLVACPERGVFLENDWIGQRLQVGSVRANVVEGAKRCGMTLVAQPGLVEQPEILRNILRHNKRTLGVYCDITWTGTINVGDTVHIEL